MRPKLVFATGSIFRGYDFEENFALAKKAGYDGVDYLASLKDLIQFPTHILEYSRKYNIPILTVHQPIWLVFFSPDILFPFMAKLAAGFPNLILTNHHLSGVINLTKNPNHVQKLINIGKKYNVKFSLENNPTEMRFYPAVTHRPDSFAKFMRENNFPITMDTSHLATHGYDIVTFFSQNHSRIELIHVSDFKSGKQHLPLGEGTLPLQKLFKEIKEKKWNKTIVFELGDMEKNVTKGEKYKRIKTSVDFAKNYLS